MFEFNGKTYYKVFEVGKIPSYMDPSKKYNEDYIMQVAKNYDPVNVHEAPFWIGHPDYFSEPRAGGWIDHVLAMGKELYVSFSEVFPWMKELFNSGEFKKCSVEMGELELNSDGDAIPYLWALGATNIPAVKGLPVIKFQDKVEHKMLEEEKLKNKIVLSLLSFDVKTGETKKEILKNNNNTEMENIKKLADTFGVKYTDQTTEAELTSAVDTKVKELKASEENSRKALEASKEAGAVKLVDNAITAGQITPAQKDEFVSFAKSNFSECEKVLSALPKSDLTEKTDVNNKGTVKLSDDNKADLSKTTYEDVLREPEKFIGILKDEDIEKLRSGSHRFKDSPVLK